MKGTYYHAVNVKVQVWLATGGTEPFQHCLVLGEHHQSSFFTSPKHTLEESHSQTFCGAKKHETVDGNSTTGFKTQCFDSQGQYINNNISLANPFIHEFDQLHIYQ